MSIFQPNPSQLKVLECREKLCAIAGAGSGKTGTLVETIVRRLEEARLASKPLSVTDILALTFTEKAAAELRERLFKAFRQKQFSEPENETFWRVEAARLDRTDIGTIHGYALKLVKENAIYLGLPSPSAIEDGKRTLKADLSDITIDWLDEVDPDFLGLLKVFSHKNLLNILETCAGRLSGWGLSKLWADLEPPADNFEKLLQSFRQTAAEGLFFVYEGDLNKAKPYYEKVKTAMELLNSLVNLPSENLLADIDHQLNLFYKILHQGGSIGCGDWYTKAGRGLRGELRATLAPLIAYRGHELALPIKEKLVRLINRLPEKLKARKNRRGTLDFDDILIEARRLLATRPEIRRREAARCRFLVVDEFQDTNRLQTNLLAWLLWPESDSQAYPEDYDAWAKLPWAQTAPRFSVFGDLKQSIYRFRGAEVQLMAALRDTFQSEASGAVLPLDVNYRSQEPLVDFFNSFFSGHLSQGQFTSHDVQKPARPALYSGPPVMLVTTADRPNTATESVSVQAKALAIYLHELFNSRREILVTDENGQSRPPQPGDVAVLFRRRRHMAFFKETLAAAGWPCQTVAGSNPFDYDEVKGVLAAFAYLCGLDENVNLAGLLRSPLGPVSDEALAFMVWPEPSAENSQPNRPVSLTQYFSGSRPWPRHLSPDERGILNELKEMLNHLRALVGRRPPTEILEQIIEIRHLIPFAATAVDGPERIKALHDFMALSRKIGCNWDHNPQLPAEELLELWRLSESGTAENEAGLSASQAIKLMTVHTAKGLEFPVVIIAEADWKKHSGGPRPALISSQGQLAICFKGEAQEQVKPPDYLAIAKRSAQEETEEDGRLLYVAATRAKDHLALLGWEREKRKPENPPTWFEAVAEFQNDKPSTGRVIYEPEELAAPVKAQPATSNGPRQKPEAWPFDLLNPATSLKCHRLPVTALSLFLADPEAYYRERHLGLKRGFGWHPESGKPFFQTDEKRFNLNAPANYNSPGGLKPDEAGVLFHAILENIDPAAPKTNHLLAKAAVKLRLAPSPAENSFIAEKIEIFLNSSLGVGWRLGQAAGLLEAREWPFRLRVPGPEPESHLTLSGVIDLFYVHPDGYGQIVDYKLAKCHQESAELTAYEIQLKIYAQALLAAGFKLPIKAALYFAENEPSAIRNVVIDSTQPMGGLMAKLHRQWPLLAAWRPIRAAWPGPPLSLIQGD